MAVTLSPNSALKHLGCVFLRLSLSGHITKVAIVHPTSVSQLSEQNSENLSRHAHQSGKQDLVMTTVSNLSKAIVKVDSFMPAMRLSTHNKVKNGLYC